MSDSKVKTAENPKGDKITLDFDGPLVTPDIFREAVCAFIDLLLGVSEEVAGPQIKLVWNVEVKKGSRLLTANRVPDVASIQAGKETIRAIRNGIVQLGHGADFQPPYFNQRALRGAKNLGFLMESKHPGISYVRIRTNGHKCEITAAISSSADRLMSGTREEFGSVQGKLRTVSDKSGTIQFVVFDDLYEKGINCFVNEEIAESVINAFRKRVIVQGMVKYDRAGNPISIRAEKIAEFRDASELPTLDELYDIFNKAG